MTETKLTLDSIGPELKRAVEAAQDKKASDILVLEMTELTSFTDYFLICSGSSHRQVESIAEGIQRSLRDMKVRPAHVEGFPKGEWILLDYIDFVVHVFTPKSRDYYELERLWGDAEKLAVAS